MPIPTRETLKAYFETADVPTQAQFAALIDAAFDLAQEANDKSDAAVATANAAAANVARAFGLIRFYRTGSAGPASATLKANGCTIAAAFTFTGSTGSYSIYTVDVTITPTVDFDDDDFVITPTIERAAQSYQVEGAPNVGMLVTRAVDEVTVSFSLAMQPSTENFFEFAIFD